MTYIILDSYNDNFYHGSDDDVKEVADEYYHNHFTADDDYDENFEHKTLKDALEFLLINDFEVFKGERVTIEEL